MLPHRLPVEQTAATRFPALTVPPNVSQHPQKSPFGQIDRIELADKVVGQPLPVGVRPSVGFVAGGGDLDAYGVVLQVAVAVEFVLKPPLVNDHSLPDAFEGNAVGQSLSLMISDLSFSVA